VLDAGAVVVPRLSSDLIRHAPESNRKLLELLRNGLGWPIPARLEEIPLLDFSPEELHLDPSKVARLTKIQQLPKLVDDQTFAAFVLSFKGGSLPQGAIRRLVARLVKKRRASRTVAMGLWEMEDIIFFCVSEEGNPRLHIVSFRESNDKTVIKVISWSNKATDNKIELLAKRELTDLVWGDLGVTVDARNRAFSGGYRQEIRSAQDLATQMAEIACRIRDEIMELLSVETDTGSLRSLFKEVKRDLRSDLTHKSFADMYAQTMVYGLLASRIAHPENFRGDSVVNSLKFDNPFLDALYSSFRKRADGEIDIDEFGLQDLVQALVDADVEGLLASFGTDELKDDPVVFFYEEFLEKYDPVQRKDLGTYYTPIPVVRFMVRSIDEIIKREFGLPLGVADDTTWAEYSKSQGLKIPDGLTPEDKVVRVIDPATGTGTFLLEWIRQAKENLRRAGRHDALAMQEVINQIDAFEISLSSYAVAHLKTSLELAPELRAQTHLGIRLTDTLAGKADRQQTLFNDDPIAVEGARAMHVKFEAHHSVVLGNPPYRRCKKNEIGSLLFDTELQSGGLFADYLDDAVKYARKGHLPNLYNLYVAFIRFAAWKAFDQHGTGPGVVAFITASSWLDGPAFLGLRRHLRESCDHLYVIDLGGDTNIDPSDHNIFPIKTPTAIFIAVRLPRRQTSQLAAKISYVRLQGDRQSKLGSLTSLSLGEFPPKKDPPPYESLKARSDDGPWLSWPRLIDILPLTFPGCKVGRTWPIAPAEKLLVSRWKRLLAEKDLSKRAEMFKPDTSGRDIYSKPRGVKSLSEESLTVPRIARYLYRAFDRQWMINDIRVASRYRKELWDVLSESQVFLVSRVTHSLTSGPGAFASAYIPDLDCFRGSYGGKDVIPLYRNSGTDPNIAPSVLATLRDLLGEEAVAGPESVFAYCYGVLAGTNYVRHFQEELRTPGPRIPFTRSPQLFLEMAEFGCYLLWLQTFGERFRTAERKVLNCDSTIRWSRRPTRIPADQREIGYDAEMHVLTVADGKLTGVSEAAWNFEVSGLQVVKKWFSYRTAKGAGRAASSDNLLDKIRPTAWQPEWCEELREIIHVLTETERERLRGTAILQKILSGDLISADELPQPPDELRFPQSREIADDRLDLAGDAAEDDD